MGVCKNLVKCFFAGGHVPDLGLVAIEAVLGVDLVTGNHVGSHDLNLDLGQNDVAQVSRMAQKPLHRNTQLLKITSVLLVI